MASLVVPGTTVTVMASLVVPGTTVTVDGTTVTVMASLVLVVPGTTVTIGTIGTSDRDRISNQWPGTISALVHRDRMQVLLAGSICRRVPSTAGFTV